MMGPRQVAQAALFYEFSLEDHVPQDHLLRSIDGFVDLSDKSRPLWVLVVWKRIEITDFDAGIGHGVVAGRFSDFLACSALLMTAEAL